MQQNAPKEFGIFRFGPAGLNVDADPEEQKQTPETHEAGGDERHEELLLQVARKFVGRDFVDEEPRGEEEPDGEQDDGQVGKDGRVHRRHVAGHPGDVDELLCLGK